MATNINNTPIDTVLDEIDKLFKTHYLGYKNHSKPYEEVITEIEKFKNNISKEKILISISEKIDDLETVLGYETTLWNMLFVIIGLFVSIISSVYLENYNVIFNNLNSPSNISVGIIMILVVSLLIVIILYCLSVKPNVKKLKKKCYYKFVYDILSAD